MNWLRRLLSSTTHDVVGPADTAISKLDQVNEQLKIIAKTHNIATAELTTIRKVLENKQNIAALDDIEQLMRGK